MQQEFTISKGWKIFIYLGSLLLLGLAVFAFAMAREQTQLPQLILLATCGAGFVGLTFWGILDATRLKVMVSDAGVTLRTAFRTREIPYYAISGFKTSEHDVEICSAHPTKGNIKIRSFRYLSNKAELVDWLDARFDNLTVGKYLGEFNQIITENSFGMTDTYRFDRLKEARRINSVLTIFGAILFIWLFFIAYPYRLALWSGIIFPLILIYVYYHFKGLVVIANDKGESPYPSLSITLFGVIFSLMLRVIDFNILNWTRAILPALITIVALSVIFWMIRTSRQTNPGKSMDSNAVIAVFILIYSISCVIIINCICDRSPEKVYTTTVQEAEARVFIKNYTLTLDKWAEHEQGDASVSGEVYDHVSKKDRVKVHVKKGLLNIPWYYVTR